VVGAEVSVVVGAGASVEAVSPVEAGASVEVPVLFAPLEESGVSVVTGSAGVVGTGSDAAGVLAAIA
jgi:hypothetical protein